MAITRVDPDLRGRKPAPVTLDPRNGHDRVTG
jgi:hypothetical protein